MEAEAEVAVFYPPLEEDPASFAPVLRALVPVHVPPVERVSAETHRLDPKTQK